ncbi:MAG: epoxyqueuosine reductase QueH [candidate division FCPU426 bacterium]
MGKSKVLLHICCAPDATATVERLRAEYDVLGYFQNDNIHPPEEFSRRLDNAERVAVALGFPLVPAGYHPEAWQTAVAGWEDEPERGRRCEACFRHNLAATAAKARELNIPAFATTLTISPHKDAALIFRLGRELARQQGVRFLEMDFKKQDGFKRSLEWSRQLGLYRQNYCGCRYSSRGEKQG